MEALDNLGRTLPQSSGPGWGYWTDREHLRQCEWELTATGGPHVFRPNSNACEVTAHGIRQWVSISWEGEELDSAESQWPVAVLGVMSPSPKQICGRELLLVNVCAFYTEWRSVVEQNPCNAAKSWEPIRLSGRMSRVRQPIWLLDCNQRVHVRDVIMDATNPVAL